MKNSAFEDGFTEGMKTMHTPLPETVILEIWMNVAMVHGGTAIEFAREIEKRHGIM